MKVNEDDYYGKQAYLVSVPLRGFGNESTWNGEEASSPLKDSFRPLAGFWE